MFNLAQDLGIEFIRFEAVKPTLRSLKVGEHALFYAKSCPRFKKYLNSNDPELKKRGRGVFGVYLSHFFLHKYHDLTYPGEKYIIMEDDIEFNKTTLERIANVRNSPEYDDWEIIRSVVGKPPHFIEIPLGKSLLMEGVHRESKYACGSKIVHNYCGGAFFSLFKNSNSIIRHLESETLHAIDAVYSTDRMKVVCGNFGVKTGMFPTLIPKKNLGK